MKKIFRFVADHPKLALLAVLLAAGAGWRVLSGLPVDVFPDISVPRVTIQTEAGGLTAEEVERLVTIPIETAMNGIPGVSTIRSSSGGGLSFVWVDFDWNVDLARARFDVFERLARVRETLPAEADAELAPVVSVTGEIMLVALTAREGGASPLELRELAEYDLRARLLGIPGIGEVAVIGGRLPEYRVAVDPRRLAEHGLGVNEVIEAARDTRTALSAGYLAHVGGDEVPLRQIARAETCAALQAAALPLAGGGALRLGDVADVSLAGAPRRGSASFGGREAVVLSVQKVPGGNTLELTRALDAALESFGESVKEKGVEVHANAYRQADFINASIRGGGEVARDAVIVVVVVLLVTLLELRTLLVVLCSMPLTILLGLALFPALGLGVNVMTLGGFAVAAGDIVDAAIIFTEVIRRKLSENVARAPDAREEPAAVIARAAASVAPSVLFSTVIVVLVFVPLLMLSGLEGRFFRPLGLAFLGVFAMSLVCAWTVVPALARLFRLGGGAAKDGAAAEGLGVRLMKAVYRPFLALALRFPKLVVFAAVALALGAGWVAKDFGSSFLPPFREDAYNVALSLPPGASLEETARVSEACVPALASIPGVLSVTRRTGRAERDQHAEPVSSSEYVVRVDLKADGEAVKAAIRAKLGGIPGCSLLVGYPIAHRIGAVLSGTEAELAVNVYGEDVAVLRETVARMKTALAAIPEVSDVRANREVTVRTLRIDYDLDALLEAGLTLREAGEQVACAFNGVEVGEVRDGLRRRAVTVRLAGNEDAFDAETVKGLLLAARNGRRVRLDDVARVVPEEAPNLMLREGGRRKALISCNAAAGVDTGALVETLRAKLGPIAAATGSTVEFGGSQAARERAAKRLAVLGMGLIVIVFILLVVALGSVKAALLALVNVPLGLVGGVAAVALADPVLSVSSLVGFVTVIGFVLRNGLLLLNCYQSRLDAGEDIEAALRAGSLERMPPIVMTSLTTVFGLVPIILSGTKPGGELLAPLAVVQFGGLLGATVLNLVVMPAAAKVFGIAKRSEETARVQMNAFLFVPLLGGLLLGAGCRTHEVRAIDWTQEAAQGVTNKVHLARLEDAVTLALVGNPELNALRLKRANSVRAAQAAGWWEDPEFALDLNRIVQSSAHPFLMGSSLTFTLPLSGVPASTARAAALYAAADAAEVRAAEHDLAVNVRETAIRLAAQRERVAVLRAYDGDQRILRALDVAEKLQQAGEFSAGDVAMARRRRHEWLHRLRDAEREALAEEAAFVRLLGLLPGVKLELPRAELHHHRHALPQAQDPLAFVRHPRVVAACARLEGTEAALETEIRRQYPDLKLGPAYSREDGLDRAGLALGLTLPLWNRNRAGIAEAEGTRDATRQTAIETWRELVRSAALARANLASLLDHPHAPPSEREKAEKLAANGELNVLDYLAVREEIATLDLEEAEWRRDVCLAYEAVRGCEKFAK